MVNGQFSLISFFLGGDAEDEAREFGAVQIEILSAHQSRHVFLGIEKLDVKKKTRVTNRVAEAVDSSAASASTKM